MSPACGHTLGYIGGGGDQVGLRRASKSATKSHVPALHSRGVCTGVPRSSETAPPQDPTVGQCLGPYDGPGGVALFLDNELGGKEGSVEKSHEKPRPRLALQGGLLFYDGSGPTRRNVKRFRGGLELMAYRLLYHSTLGSRVIKKKRSPEQPRPRLPLQAGLLFRHVIYV